MTSVTGNDSLEVGDNTVSVVVTAEDGSTGTYNIVVTRRAEDDPDNSDKQQDLKKFDVNGTEWTMVNDIPEDMVPEGFEHSKTAIDGLEYNTLHGTFGDLTLVMLQSDNGNGLFVYDAAQNAAYQYVRINSESHFIVLLLPKVDDVPDGYNEVSLSIEGKGVATAYQKKDDQSDEMTKDFYLVYAMNDRGESGFYTYDSAEGTYIRTNVTTPTVSQKINNDSEHEVVSGIANKYLVLAAILVVVIIILILLLVLCAAKNRKYKALAEEYDDNQDDDDEDFAPLLSEDDVAEIYSESDASDTDDQATENTISDSSEADEVNIDGTESEAEDTYGTVSEENDTDSTESSGVDCTDAAETDTTGMETEKAESDSTEMVENNDIEINMPDDSKMTEEKHNSCTESVKDSKEKEIVRRTVEIKDDSDDLKFIDLK